LAEGKFTYWGQSAGASTESFQNLVLERGKNRLDVITANNASTTSATLSMTGGFVRNPGDGTLVVVSANTLGKPDGGDYTRVLAATAPTLLGGSGADGSTNISIIPWAYHDTDPNGSAPTTVETFLTYGATGLRPLLDSEYVTSLTAPGTLNNVRIIATSSTLAVDETINSLRYGLDAGGTITLTGHKLTINSGAILATNGSSGALTFNGGEIAFGTAEGIIQTTFGGNVVINSVISGSGGLTFSGSLGGGSLTLNGANTYTGPTTILAGGVQFNSAASFGSGGDPIRFRNSSAGGSMTYTGAGTTTLTNPIELGLRSTGINANNSGTLVLNGVISGNALTTTFSGTGLGFSGNGTIELRAANTFTGSVGLSGGTLGIVDNNNFGNATNQLSLGATSNPTLRFDAANIDLARSTVVGGHLTFDTNGFNATISGAFAGGSDAYIITKSGAGTLSLTGASTTRAKLQVSGGTVNVNGTWGTFLTTVATVNSGGSLGGNGTLNSFVTVNDGGTLAPGAGTGTLTMHSLAFAANANATYEWEAGASTQDSITITNGPLNLSGIHTTLKLYDRGLGFNVTPDQKFALFTVAGLNSITGFDPANFNVVFADASAWASGQYTLT
ncbi:MAG TPA: autotransporter-associated beta strand repeat-containing protein, partial [Gemmata sp.]|nr:autotransporter-associated beta strand repeat-containing protein [Gemmata sp.]